MTMFAPYMDMVYKFHKLFLPYSFGIMTISVLLALGHRLVTMKELFGDRLLFDVVRVMFSIAALLYFATIINSIQYLCYFPVNHALKLEGKDLPKIYIETIERTVEKGNLAQGAKVVTGGLISGASSIDTSQGKAGAIKDATVATTKLFLNVLKMAFADPVDGALKNVAVRFAFGISAMFNQLTIYILQIAMLLTFGVLIVKAPWYLAMWAWDPVGPPIVVGYFKNILCVSLWMPTLIVVMKLEMLLLESGVMTSSWGGIFKGTAFLLVGGFFKLMIPKFVASLIFGRDISTGVAVMATATGMKAVDLMKSIPAQVSSLKGKFK